MFELSHRSVRSLLIALSLLLIASGSGCNQPAATSSTSAKQVIPAKATREFAVEGMSCDGCVNNVTLAINKVPGVKSVNVSLKDKKATVAADSAPVSADAIEAAVSEAGYSAKLLAVEFSPSAGK